MPSRITRALTRYRHGPGTFKVDFAVEGGVPWAYEPAGRAGTVLHLGGGLKIERFAPGFRERNLARHARSVAQTEAHNANYVGGDVVTGSNDALQLVSRPG